MIRYFLFIALIQSFAFGQEFKLFKCPDIALPNKVKIAQCPSKKPCSNIINGKDATITGIFEFNINHKTSKLPITANVKRANGKSEIIALPFGDACNSVVKTKCPLKPGAHKIKLPLRVKDVKRGEKLTVSVTIRDNKNKPIVCAAVELTAK
uniref:LolMLd n=1 Tax=Bichromomyia olmeca TaxID=715919 RepID=A0A1B1V3G2_9DIPT|nr:LolMLd [Bichromomyia olmeca]